LAAVKNIAPCFGGINLEDIASPKCFEIEKRLEKELEIARGEDEFLVIDLRVAPVGNEYILVLADDRTEISRVQRVRNDFVANGSLPTCSNFKPNWPTMKGVFAN